MTIQLPKQHGSFSRSVFCQIVASNFSLIVIIHQTDKCAGNLTEALATSLSIMDSDNENNFVDIPRYRVQFDFEGFIVAITFTGTVITGMSNGTISRFQVVIENEICIATNLAIGCQQKCGSIEVKVLTVRRTCIPAKANQTFFMLGAVLLRETLPPLDSETLIYLSSFVNH